MKRTNTIIPIVACVVLVALLVFDCNRRADTSPAPTTTLRGEALGTFYQITVKGTLSEAFPARLDSLFGAINRSMSIFDKESLLSRINRGETDIADECITYCINLAHGVSELSDGAYDITVKPLVEAFGFAGGIGLWGELFSFAVSPSSSSSPLLLSGTSATTPCPPNTPSTPQISFKRIII